MLCPKCFGDDKGDVEMIYLTSENEGIERFWGDYECPECKIIVYGDEDNERWEE